MHPDAKTVNTNIAGGWDVLRTDALAALTKVQNEEALKGRSAVLHKAYYYYLAMQYMTILHEVANNPYWVYEDADTFKARFDWDDMVKCFACVGIDLDDLWTGFDMDNVVVAPDDP